MFSSLHLQLVHARQRELLDAAVRHREAARDDHPRAARPHRAEVLWRVAEAVRARRPATGPPPDSSAPRPPAMNNARGSPPATAQPRLEWLAPDSTSHSASATPAPINTTPCLTGVTGSAPLEILTSTRHQSSSGSQNHFRALANAATRPRLPVPAEGSHITEAGLSKRMVKTMAHRMPRTCAQLVRIRP
jgi:hypothetical protein